MTGDTHLSAHSLFDKSETRNLSQIHWDWVEIPSFSPDYLKVRSNFAKKRCFVFQLSGKLQFYWKHMTYNFFPLSFSIQIPLSNLPQAANCVVGTKHNQPLPLLDPYFWSRALKEYLAIPTKSSGWFQRAFLTIPNTSSRIVWLIPLVFVTLNWWKGRCCWGPWNP